MKLATWNVNSIRARQDRLVEWLGRVGPDVVCLQELKVTNEAFPYDAIRDAGYHAAVFGQKTYNGVAILSRSEPADVSRGMGPADEDPQARLVAATLGPVRVVCAYFPNGKVVGSEHYAYKLAWMDRLRAYFEASYTRSELLVLCGDFNVAPDDSDVARPAQWAGSVLCHGDARRSLEAIRRWGLIDVFRKHHPEGGIYSWWDYRMLAFPKNDGLRIDHIFATEPLASRSTGVEVDRGQRKGQKPSDHAPVIATFDL